MNANTKQSNRKLRASDKRILWCHSKINSISIELSNWILLPIFWSHSFHPILFCSNFSLAFSLLFVHIRRTYTSGKKIHHNSNSFPYKSLYSFCEFFGEKKVFFLSLNKAEEKSSSTSRSNEAYLPKRKKRNFDIAHSGQMWENVFTFDVFSWMKFDVGSILISKRGKIETRWVWGSAFFSIGHIFTVDSNRWHLLVIKIYGYRFKCSVCGC